MKKIFLFIIFSYWIFFSLIPPFQTPDEASHFEFIYWLSQGIYPRIPKGDQYILHLSNIQQNLFKNLVQHDTYIPNFPKIRQSNLQKKTDYTNLEKKQSKPIAGQAYNPPFYYAIGALFLLTAKLFHSSLLSQIYWVRLTSALFYFLSIVTGYKIFLAYFKKEKIANGLVLFFGLNPLLIQSGIGISPDIAMVFFTNLFLLFVLYFREKGNTQKYILILGILAGFACLSKITCIILIPGFLVYVYFQTKNSKKFFKQSLTFLLSCFVVVSPWLLFNMVYYHTPLVSLPALGVPLVKGVHTTFIGALTTSTWGFRHIFIHFAGFLGWNDVFPFSQVFIPFTILFITLIIVGIVCVWKKNDAFEKLLITCAGSLFLFFLVLDVVRKLYSHQGWEIGGRDALLIFLPFVIFIVHAIAVLFKKKIDQVSLYLSYFAIWYYYFVLVFVLIPRYYV